MHRVRCVRLHPAILVLVAAWAVVSLLAPCPAAAQFTIGGQKVVPQESNFAGVRHTSPRHRLVVQINHDARHNGDLELTLVDEAYTSLLHQHRTAVVRADMLPLVFVSEAKMARFGEGGRRRMFRWLESDLRRHPDVHVSPAAIFVSDQNLVDPQKLKAVLGRALAFHFNPRFREALESVERPTPDR